MTVDLTGGLPDEREFVFAAQPDDPEMRESVNAWIWDAGTEVGMPRIGVEAVADQWDTHDIQVNIGTGDGRVFNMFAPGKVHDPLGADGKPRVLGAGPLSFELVEPFRYWKLRLDGLAVQNTSAKQIAGERPVTVELGTNVVLGIDPGRIRAIPQMLKDARRPAEQIPLWDGNAGSRAAEIISEFLALPSFSIRDGPRCAQVVTEE